MIKPAFTLLSVAVKQMVHGVWNQETKPRKPGGGQP